MGFFAGVQETGGGAVREDGAGIVWIGVLRMFALNYAVDVGYSF